MTDATSDHPLATVPALALSTTDQAARRAVNAGAISFLLEIFDSYLPTVALAPAIIYFEPATLSSATKTTLFYVVFAVSLLARPLAAIVFGHIADSANRRRALSLAMAGSGVFTVITAFLPGYATWGWGAIFCLLIMRFVGGLFLGGVSVSATPLALENSATARQGLIGAYVTAGYPLGAACVSIVTMVLVAVLPSAGLDSAFVQWGWRLPFVAGGIVTLMFLSYIRKIPDSLCAVDADERRARRMPIVEIMGKGHLRRLCQVSLVYVGIWFAFEGASTATPGILVTYLKGSPTVLTAALVGGNIALVGCYFLYGRLGQRFGSRRTLIGTGVSNIVAGAGLYAVAITIFRLTGQMVPAAVLICVSIIIATAQFPVAAVFTNAKFPRRLRASGYGIAYNFSILIPSFYSFYMLGLQKFMSYPYTPVVLIAIGGVCTVVGAVLGRSDDDSPVESAIA